MLDLNLDGTDIKENMKKLIDIKRFIIELNKIENTHTKKAIYLMYYKLVVDILPPAKR